MKTLKTMVILAAISATVFGCQKSISTPPNEEKESFDRTVKMLTGNSTNAKLPRPQSWADCLLFDGVVTPATFKPASDPFDELYVNNLGYGFKDGKALISESKPGDQDYNGGRWHMNVIKPGVDPMKYMYACSVEDLDLYDFMRTENYFECPLLPRKN